MENVVLIVHLLLALGLIGVVLLQRSEGGGLGMGTQPLAAGRGGATALGKVTWGLGIAFVITSLALTIIAAEQSGGASVVDRITDLPEAEELAPAVDLDQGGGLLPTLENTGPLVPQVGDQPTDSAPVAETAPEAAPETAPEAAPETAPESATETAPATGG